MEKLKEDVIHDTHALLDKIEDEDIKVFSENFIKLIDVKNSNITIFYLTSSL